MSTLSGSSRSYGSHAIRHSLPIDAVDDWTGRPARYLTDGHKLYRVLGISASGMGEMVGLEDCRTLIASWVPIGEVHARRLRAVTPAGES